MQPQREGAPAQPAGVRTAVLTGPSQVISVLKVELNPTLLETCKGKESTGQQPPKQGGGVGVGGLSMRHQGVTQLAAAPVELVTICSHQPKVHGQKPQKHTKKTPDEREARPQ